MKRMLLPQPRRLLIVLIALGGLAVSSEASTIKIVEDSKASATEVVAAKEVARYFYVRTRGLLPIVSRSRIGGGSTILVAAKQREIVMHSIHDPKLITDIQKLKPQEYVLRRVSGKLYVVGGDEIGTLYGAYRLAEVLGVRFYLHGDTVPDGFIPVALPQVDEIGRPLFSLRGIQPFHDFPEGPDWWTENDYLSIIAQLPKLRMNFIGFHTYPEGGVGPEPMVWIGQPSEVHKDGSVASAYPSHWAATSRDATWGYAAARTSTFSNGASELFAKDTYGSSFLRGLSSDVDIFNATGRVLSKAFRLAHSLGVKTCVGTETPLTIPKAVRAKLLKDGKDPGNQDVVRELYRGVFSRIARAYPTDFYWLWTPEDWTWSGNTPEQLKKTVDDLKSANLALKELGNPMTLATSGWVLGPQNDRAALDRELPKAVPVSTINQDVGFAPVEPGFGDIKGRSKWAIPWMENDPALSAPQMWAGRMKYDAADAYRLGCDGLFGIHWRTKILAPTVASLAQATWDSSLADPRILNGKREPLGVGAKGGSLAAFPQEIAGTNEQAVYRTCRYGMSGYDLKVPNGTYHVTLKFCEPFYTHPKERVFNVSLGGKPVIEDLDILAKAGKDHALDFVFGGQRVTDGILRIRFEAKIGLPMICGIVVLGDPNSADKLYARRINCGGAKFESYEADNVGDGWAKRERTLSVGSFYEDFAKANFGSAVAKRIGRIFAQVDGTALPEPAGWIDGPGGIKIDSGPLIEVAHRFQFVDRLSSVERYIAGAGNRERFHYWLESFRFMQAMAEVGCLRGRLDGLMKGLAQESEDAKKAIALEVRVEMTDAWNRMMNHLLQTVSTSGEMGTVSNLEQHVALKQQILTFHDPILEKVLGHPLPASTHPATAYSGSPRLVITTTRSLVQPGENLTIPVLLLGGAREPEALLKWRPIGSHLFHTALLTHLGRGVYSGSLPIDRSLGPGVEYYISAIAKNGKPLVYPPTAPEQCQTVVVQ